MFRKAQKTEAGSQASPWVPNQREDSPLAKLDPGAGDPPATSPGGSGEGLSTMPLTQLWRLTHRFY